ncbi:MAG: hypothetical protein R2911_04285 [Caldilineaceae bacterium]
MTGLELTLRTLALGPLRNTADLTWPLLMGLLPLLGVYSLWRAARRYNERTECGAHRFDLWLGCPHFDHVCQL